MLEELFCGRRRHTVHGGCLISGVILTSRVYVLGFRPMDGWTHRLLVNAGTIYLSTLARSVVARLMSARPNRSPDNGPNSDPGGSLGI